MHVFPVILAVKKTGVWFIEGFEHFRAQFFIMCARKLE
jgi:hypothetical protein